MGLYPSNGISLAIRDNVSNGSTVPISQRKKPTTTSNIFPSAKRFLKSAGVISREMLLSLPKIVVGSTAKTVS